MNIDAPAASSASVPPGPTSPVRWALVGYGSGGRVFHAPLISSAVGIEFVAVVSGNPERRTLVGDDHPGVVVVDALEDLPALGVQGVTISTPPGTHSPLAHRALGLGLHVLVDKPFALSAAAAAELVTHAATVSRLITAYQNRRWDSDFLTVRRLIDDGSLGAVHRFTSRIDRFRPVRAGWATSVAEGGGTLFDLGPHLVDQALDLFGAVARVHAEVRSVRDPSGADDEIELHLEHVGGVHSTLAAGMASAAEGPRFQVAGSAGGYLVNGFDVQEAQLKAGHSPASLGLGWGVEEPGAFGTLTTAEGSVPMPSARGRWDLFYPAMAAAITGTGPIPVVPDDAIATAAVIDAARASAAERRVVEIVG